MTLLFALGCAYTVSVDETGVFSGERARLEIEGEAFDFGDVEVNTWTSQSTTVRNTGGLPMGLRVDATDDAFCAHWRQVRAGCGEDVVTASAKGDTGGGSGGTGHTGDIPTEDTGFDPEKYCADGYTHSDDPIVLDPGCEIEAVTVFTPDQTGTYLAGMRVEAAEIALDDLAWVDRDPRNFVQHVRLDGHGGTSTSFLAVSWDPPVGEFAWRWPDGGSSLATMNVVNVGDAPVTIDTVTTSCPEFAVTSAPPAGTILAAGERSADIEFAYTPTSFWDRTCIATVTTAESANAIAILRSTVPAHSAAPTLAVLSPTPGERLVREEAVLVVGEVADESQPPSSLWIRVRSSVALVSLDAYPVDDSGRATLRIPAGDLLAGPDTLDISVTDLHGNETHVTVPVRVDAEPLDDTDGDGWGVADGDCDDNASTTYPFALEILDGLDTDCDGVVDDNTDTFDDDGDGMTEADGDCDDANANTYPGAPERVDSEDNDCDDVVDNDTTVGDDDGDGFSESDNDCDDSDAAISPLATEICDGYDNDCDGLKDEADVSGGCPRDDDLLVAYIDVEPDACLTGETITATLVALPADAAVQWGTDARVPELQGATGSEATFICPGVDGDGDGLNLVIYALVSDTHGEQKWAQATARVWVDPENLSRNFSRGEPIVVTTACNPEGASAFVGVLGILGLATLARRRRDAPKPPA